MCCFTILTICAHLLYNVNVLFYHPYSMYTSVVQCWCVVLPSLQYVHICCTMLMCCFTILTVCTHLLYNVNVLFYRPYSMYTSIVQCWCVVLPSLQYVHICCTMLMCCFTILTVCTHLLYNVDVLFYHPYSMYTSVVQCWCVVLPSLQYVHICCTMLMCCSTILTVCTHLLYNVNVLFYHPYSMYTSVVQC